MKIPSVDPTERRRRFNELAQSHPGLVLASVLANSMIEGQSAASARGKSKGRTAEKPQRA